MDVPTIATKPAAGVFSMAVTGLGLSIAESRWGYNPSTMEVGYVYAIVAGLSMWLIPPTIRRKLNGE